jgi:hypothetical protein
MKMCSEAVSEWESMAENVSSDFEISASDDDDGVFNCELFCLDLCGQFYSFRYFFFSQRFEWFTPRW